MRRVVVTGLGPVHAIGTGVQDFFAGIEAMRPVVMAIDPEVWFGRPLNTGWYVPAPILSPDDYEWLRSRLRDWAGPTAQLAAVAARLALEDAELDSTCSEASVIMGVGNINLGDAIGISRQVDDKGRLNILRTSRLMTNAVSSCVGIALAARGQNLVVSSACASGTDAIGMGYQQIATGNSDLVVCGGADVNIEDQAISLRYFDSLGVLTSSLDGLPRPFASCRSGFLFAEAGACAVVLEDLATASARGAAIYAEITDYVANCDAFHVVRLPEKATQQERLVRRLLRRGPIGHYNAHGTGTVKNDKLEAGLITELWPSIDSQPLVCATKSLLGHTIGASGAFEVAVVAQSMRHGRLHGTLTDPIEGIRIAQKTIDVDTDSAISVSFGFGGHNAGLRLERYAG